MRIPNDPSPDPIPMSIDVEMRTRDFDRLVPQLRRFASRLLSPVREVEIVLAKSRERWMRTEGSFDSPTRYLLRLVAQGCIERQREITRSLPGPTDEERAFLKIADVAEVSLLIAVNRLPRRAREAFVASVLGRSIASTPKNPTEQVHASPRIAPANPSIEPLQLATHRTCLRVADEASISGALRAE